MSDRFGFIVVLLSKTGGSASKIVWEFLVVWSVDKGSINKSEGKIRQFWGIHLVSVALV